MGCINSRDEDVEEVGEGGAAGMAEMVAVEETCLNEVHELCKHKRRVGGRGVEGALVDELAGDKLDQVSRLHTPMLVGAIVLAQSGEQEDVGHRN